MKKRKELTFVYEDFRLRFHEPYGYVVQRKVGTQWKESRYHLTLDMAIINMIERKFRIVNHDLTVHLVNTEEALSNLNQLAYNLSKIYSEVMELINAN